MLFICNLCRPASRYLNGYSVMSIKHEHGVDSVLSGKCCCVLLVLPIDKKFHYFKIMQKIHYSVRLSLCFYHFTSSKGTTFLRRVLKPVGLVWNLRLLSPASAAGPSALSQMSPALPGFLGGNYAASLCLSHDIPGAQRERDSESSSTCSPAPAPCFCLL